MGGLGDVSFCTDTFGHRLTKPYAERVLACLVWALIFADEDFLKSPAASGFPSLYKSGVFWQAEKPTGRSGCKGGDGQEQFLGARQVLEQGHADCEDVASWRVAELRTGHVSQHLPRGMGPFAGHPRAVVLPCPWPGNMRPVVDVCPAFFSREVAPGSWIYHILVCWPDGTLEDPSRQLGMGGARRYG